jgi:hypothetical protein
MAAKLLRPRRFETISIVLYLALGWIGLVALRPFLTSLDTTTLALLGAGGVLYTVGVVFHVRESLPYHNAIWHGFVLTGAVVHYAARSARNDGVSKPRVAATHWSHVRLWPLPTMTSIGGMVTASTM